jgi:hypothetical protein
MTAGFSSTAMVGKSWVSTIFFALVFARCFKIVFTVTPVCAVRVAK